MSTDLTQLLFFVAYNLQKVNFDYTPQWQRGNPSSYIDAVVFPRVLTNKAYQYRVVTGDKDLGIKPSYSVQPDGSQKVNLLEYNGGYGVADTTTIKIYVVDPSNGNQYLIAQWK
ncbi:hypothetical protein AX16_009765 [Volvariella volvacea WC 439]|nr:hypothetical protein AX16_009765 [Volvariella volvacea WC 439]